MSRASRSGAEPSLIGAEVCSQQTNLTEMKKHVPARATEPGAKIENKLPARATEFIFPCSSTRCPCTGF